MRKIYLLFLLSISFLNLNGQQKYQAPKLDNENSWSMILIPDPQTYLKFARYQPILDLMNAWIQESVDPLNIKMVLCTGDLVEHNDMPNPDGKNGDQPSKSQWEAVSRSFDKLNGRVPYLTATGNHDFGYKSAVVRRTFYDKYFPTDKNFLNQKLLREVGVDGDGHPSLTNAVYEMTSPHGQKLFMVLEFAPRDAVIEWAKKVVDQEKYKDHFVILLTHTYLNAKSETIETEG